MRRHAANLGPARVVLAAAIILAASWLIDFALWRLQHPSAPAWTFLFR
jgi:hypothetical protein